MTIPVGKQLALFIESLSRHFKTNINSVTHIIGFSLGAHVAGFAGTQLKNLSRITGIAQSISYFFVKVIITSILGMLFEIINLGDLI